MPKRTPPLPPERRRRKDARPSELIEAGLQEFAARGFAGTRLEDVARRAGVVKGTIYRYFDDKEALFVAAVRSKLPAFIDPIDGLIDSFQGTTRELLLRVLTVMYAELVDSDIRILMRIVLSEGTQFPELSELYYRESIARVRPFLDKLVARGVARGEVRVDHARLLPMIIAAPALMASIWKMTFDKFEPIDTQDFFDAHTELLFRGLLVPGAPT
jgi:AcrR family transcriptional regulator